MENIMLREYPFPNPAVKQSTTRFASRIETVQDGQGNRSNIEHLTAAEPKCPVSTFIYDGSTRTGRFENVLNGEGQIQILPARKIPPYIPSAELKELVRLAQVLQRPVLIKGEPGSGKTQLAKAVAWEWYGDDYKKHFFEWQVKSTSKAVDGLYTFDHIDRLRKANLNRSKADTEKKEDLLQYRSFGPMGKAFLTSTLEAPSILLIDEIDKADIDFPNDLLLELDERRFVIPDSETGEVIEARYPPLIFITSNDERELPEAFLRRCLFLYIKFPDDAQLLNIIRAHIPGFVEKHESLVQKAITQFSKLRKEIEDDPSDNKRVSTSELLDWLTAFYYDLSITEADKIGEKQQELEGRLGSLPYSHTVLKSNQSINRQSGKK